MDHETGSAITILVLSALIYFLPTGIALLRGHRNTVPIGLLNLFLGWTGLGWLAALIWSFTSNVDEFYINEIKVKINHSK